METSGSDPIAAVYDLREAAVEHGRAVARLETESTPQARDQVLATQTALEEKTVRALDECSENAEEAVSQARDEGAF